MKLTIHRGTHEIGGSCVELQTKSADEILRRVNEKIERNLY